MITALDHVVIVTPDIDAGASAYQALLGCAPSWRNKGDGVARVLFTLDNMTVEMVAPDGGGEGADRIRAVLDTQGEGLASLCFRTPDIAKMHRRLERLTLKPEPVTEAESRDEASGGKMSWKRTRAATDRTHGVRLFFLELAGERARSPVTANAPITSMDHVVVATPDPERAAALYGARLGLDMALDRSHPEWGQLMFFRCGDLIVEVAHRPGREATSGPDRLYGISWRVIDADATRARLLAAGLDVSDVRTGRRPGTRVLTVKTGTCGVPTLLIEKSLKPD